MSGVDAFFDTSVVLYLLSADARKADRVENLLSRRGVISIQVLNEFAAVALRKTSLAIAEVRELLESVRFLCAAQPLTIEVHQQGLEVCERYGFSVYDSIIVAAALRAGCRRLYTEDLQHGQVIEKRLAIVNPFVG